MIGVDYSGKSTDWPAFAEALKNKGAEFAMRYLGEWPSGKGATKEELDALAAAGIKVGFFYQENVHTMLGGRCVGVQHVTEARKALEALGLPVTTPVYYCMDDEVLDGELVKVKQYLEAAGQIAGKDALGIYGSRKVVAYCLDNGLVKYACQASGFPGEWEPRAHLRQEWLGWNIGGIPCNCQTATQEDVGLVTLTPPGPRKADLILTYAHIIRKQPYKLGNEPWYNFGWEPSSDPLAGDCSGLMVGLWKRAGVLFKKGTGWVTYDKFFGSTRPTAHIIYSKATKLAKPERFGDLGFHIDSANHAYHVWMYIPHPSNPTGTIEFGDGNGRADEHNYAWQMAQSHKVVWGRVPDDIGTLTIKGDPTLIDWPVMQKGYSGVHTRELKSLLIQLLGLSWTALTIKYGATGNSFGASTESAVKKLQAKLGVPVTGIVDAVTVLATQRALL